MLELGIFISCRQSKSIEFFFMYVMTCSLFVISPMPLTFKDATLSSLAYSHLGALTLVSPSYFTGSFGECKSFFHCALPQVLYPSVPPAFEALTFDGWIGPVSTHLSGLFPNIYYKTSYFLFFSFSVVQFSSS